MEARHGACASCGAKYKVPATFKANKARCKACGGVVEIGPVQAEAPADAAGAAAGAAAAQAVPAKKPAPRKPVGGPVARPVTPKADKPAARPTRARATEVEADEAEAAPAKSRTRARASSGKAGSSGRRAGGAKRSGARAGKRGAAGDDDAAASPRAGARGRAKAKKKSPMPLVAGVAVVVLAAAGGWYVMKDGGEEVSAADAGTTASAPDDPVLEDSTTGAEDTGLEDSTSGLEDAPAAGDEPEPEPEKPAKAKKKADPDSVDLGALVVFGPAPETSPEEWAQYEEWVAAVVDPDSGILGSRARKSLTDTGRPAYPAIVNAMLELNYASDVHVKSGDRCQTALREILSGNNFGWKYTTSPEDEYFNKKVVVLFHGQWVKAENNLEYWIKMAKLDEDEAAALKAELGGVVQTPPADDDEELFDIDD